MKKKKKKNQYAKHVPTSQSLRSTSGMFRCSSLRLLEWQEHTVAIGNISSPFYLDGGDGDSALPENVNDFQSLISSLSCDLFPSIISQPFGKIQLKQQQCFDYTVTTHYEEVSKLTIFFSFFFFLFFFLFLFFYFFTEGTQESQKTLSIAIHQLGFPSPALGRLCPLFLDRAELHWWPPHE